MARFMIKASEYKNVCKAVNDRKLAELKKEIIEILKKQDEKEVKKAIDYFNSQELHYTHLEKSFTGKWVEKAGYGIGTVRIWKGKKYKKIAPGKWARVFEKEGRGTNIAIGKLIAKVQKIDNVEDLMAFVMQNKQRFVDENGVDLPVLDKLRAAVDERNGNVGSKGTSKPAEKGNKKSGLSDDARIALLNLHDRNKDDAQSILSKYIKNTKDETQKRAYEEAYNYLSINDMPKFKDGKIVNEKPAEKKEDIWNKISDFSDSYGNKYKVAKKEDFSESEIKEIESKVKELSKDEKKYGKFVGIARDEKWNHPVAYFEHENGSFGGFTFNNIELKSEKKEDLDAALKEVEDAIDNAGDYDDVEELEKERKQLLKKLGKKPAETSKQTDYYKDISEVLTKDEKRRINEKVEEYSKENEWSIPAADMKKFVKDWQSALKETDKHAKAEKLYEIYSKLEDANWHDENKKLLAGNFEYFNDKYFEDMYGEEPEEKPAEKKKTFKQEMNELYDAQDKAWEGFESGSEIKSSPENSKKFYDKVKKFVDDNNIKLSQKHYDEIEEMNGHSFNEALELAGAYGAEKREKAIAKNKEINKKYKGAMLDLSMIDEFKESDDNSKTYWIQDSKGNRITSEDAKARIKDQLNQIDSFNELIAERSKADGMKMEVAKRSLEEDNKYLMDRLNPEDRKEIESEAEKHQNRSDAMKGNKNAYKGGLAKDTVKFVNAVKGEPYHDFETDINKFAIYSDDLGKQTGLVITQDIADIIDSHNEPSILDWKDAVAKEIHNKYPKIEASYIKLGLGGIRPGYRNGKKESIKVIPSKEEISSNKEKVAKRPKGRVEDIQLKNGARLTTRDGNNYGFAKVSDDRKTSIFTEVKQDKRDGSFKVDYYTADVNGRIKYDAGEEGLETDFEDMKSLEEGLNKFFERNPKSENEKSSKEIKSKADKTVQKIEKPLNNDIAAKTVSYNELKPIATNKSVGENEVQMPYSKDLADEIESLKNCVAPKWENREFMKHVYYDDGNLVTTDGRRLKIVRVGNLDGIQDGTYVDITTDKSGINIKKREGMEDYKFPPYKKVMPDNLSQNVTLDSKLVKEKIKAMQKDGAIDKKGANIVQLEFRDGKVFIDDTAVGDAKDIQLKTSEGWDDPKEDTNYVHFNADYLINALSGKTAILQMGEDNRKAMAINTGSTSNVLMPMIGSNEKMDYSAGRNRKAEENAKKDKQKSEYRQANQDFIDAIKERKGERYKKVSDSAANDLENRMAAMDDDMLKLNYDRLNFNLDKVLDKKQFITENTNVDKKLKLDLNTAILYQTMAENHPEVISKFADELNKRGISVKKSLFDDFVMDMFIDDDEEEIEEKQEDESLFNDYSAEQPELFNSTEFLVREALNRRYNCM